MKEIYIVEYKFEGGSSINQEGWTDLEKCRKWCERNGAKATDSYKMKFHWIENGDRYYLIHPITIRKGE